MKKIIPILSALLLGAANLIGQGISSPPIGSTQPVATVGVSGFWGVLGVEFAPSTTVFAANSTGNITGNNTNRIIEMTVARGTYVGHGSVQIGTGVAASTLDAGLYDVNTKAKVVALGGVSGASTGNVSASFTQVFVPAGTYYFAWCGNASSGITGLGYTAVNSSTTAGQGVGTTTILININGTRYGTAANACSSGVLPATLGALSAVNTITTSFPPAVWFEP